LIVLCFYVEAGNCIHVSVVLQVLLCACNLRSTDQ